MRRFAVLRSCLLVFGGLVLSGVASGAEPATTWQQVVEKMPVGGADAALVASETPTHTKLAPWIWGPDEDRSYRLSTEFLIS